jgi:T5SS/PEP-CTERM-associated repeat protein
MTVNTTGAAFFNVGAGFEAAPGSSGTITLDGGTYTNTYGEVATNFNGSPSANSTGTLTLTNNASLVLEPGNPGQGLEFDVGVSFEAGYSATGNLLIEGGATLEARNTVVINTGTGTFDGGYFNINIGRNVDAKGYATVTGVGSRLTTEGGAARLTIGRNEGQGTLDIENGGFVGAFNLTIGREGIGRINVDGAGSELKTSSAYGFYSGTPQLEATGYNTFGRGDDGKGYLTVTNSGTETSA